MLHHNQGDGGSVSNLSNLGLGVIDARTNLFDNRTNLIPFGGAVICQAFRLSFQAIFIFRRRNSRINGGVSPLSELVAESFRPEFQTSRRFDFSAQFVPEGLAAFDDVGIVSPGLQHQLIAGWIAAPNQCRGR